MIVFDQVLNIKTVSEANRVGENPFVASKRHKKHKKQIRDAFIVYRPKVTLPCEITLTRISPRSLDTDDNLRMAFKYIKDYIADQILPGQAPGRADSDKRIKWHYDQKKGAPKTYSIQVQINCEEKIDLVNGHC